MTGPRCRARSIDGAKFYAAATPCDPTRGYSKGCFHPAVRIVAPNGDFVVRTIYSLYCTDESKARQAAVSYCKSLAAARDADLELSDDALAQKED